MSEESRDFAKDPEWKAVAHALVAVKLMFEVQSTKQASRHTNILRCKRRDNNDQDAAARLSNIASN